MTAPVIGHRTAGTSSGPRPLRPRLSPAWIAPGLIVLVAAGLFFGAREVRGRRTVTFFVVSDLHYGLSPTVAEANRATVEAMNGLPGTPYPAPVRGAVDRPRGVVVLGDLTEDGGGPGGDAAWREFVADYGLNGEGRLRYPVYEGAGNHDGGASGPVRRGVVERNGRRRGLVRVSADGFHYSWDWGPVRGVQLNLFPGEAGDDIVNPWGRKFEGDWKYPGHSLEFLAADLGPRPGRRGRAVVLFQHYGWDEWGRGWWSAAERAAFAAAIRDRGVLAVFWGHSHSVQKIVVDGVPTYCVGAGQDDPAPGVFLVVRIARGEMTVAERTPSGWGFVDTVRRDR